MLLSDMKFSKLTIRCKHSYDDTVEITPDQESGWYIIRASYRNDERIPTTVSEFTVSETTARTMLEALTTRTDCDLLDGKILIRSALNGRTMVYVGSVVIVTHTEDDDKDAKLMTELTL